MDKETYNDRRLINDIFLIEKYAKSRFKQVNKQWRNPNELEPALKRANETDYHAEIEENKILIKENDL